MFSYTSAGIKDTVNRFEVPLYVEVCVSMTVTVFERFEEEVPGER